MCFARARLSGRAVEKFKILNCILFRVSNVIARKACEAIDVQRE